MGSTENIHLEKEEALRRFLREKGRVVIAYSGGVDSAYLAFVANAELGSDAVCVTGISPSVSGLQRDRAAEFALEHGINHVIVETDEINDARYAENPSNRCYFCKSELFGKLRAMAAELEVGSVLDGTNADDGSDFRPGSRAADESEVESPLALLGFSKEEIRQNSRRHGLATWDLPASPCLASRIQYGIPVTIERLGSIEKAEKYLHDLGFREFRVRSHGEIARLEFADDEIDRAYSEARKGGLVAFIKKLGFEFVVIDPEGFRSGSLNAGIASDPTPAGLSEA